MESHSIREHQNLAHSALKHNSMTSWSSNMFDALKTKEKWLKSKALE